MFSELSTQAKELALLQKKYENHIIPSKDLPKDYEDALLRFRFYVKQAAKGPLGVLKMTVTASPPLQRFFAREPPVDPSSSKIVIVSKPGVNPSKSERILLWLLGTLWEDGQNLFLASMPLIVDELERLLQSDQHIQDLISSYISSVIGDLSIISQTLNQLELYQPWAQTWEPKMAEVEKEYSKEYAQRTQSWAKMLASLSENNLKARAAELGQPSGGKFTYPIHKRRTKDNVEALRQAEHNLDAFWASIDQLMIAKAGDLRNTAVRNLLSQPRILQRTPEWTEPQKATPAAPAPTTGEADRYSCYLPISTIYSGISPRQLDVAPTKQKTKTRGTPHLASSADAEAESLHESNPFDKQPTFQVDARAHKVFRTIFFNPATSSTPGEVSWNDFLHAMTLVGFAATKLYGSVWQFQPTTLDVERSIQFHEPHPRGKVPFTTARRIGRRLNRAYGWFGGMFVLTK